jgi:hypothetical protein
MNLSPICVGTAVHANVVMLNTHHVLKTQVYYQAVSMQHATNSRQHYLSMMRKFYASPHCCWFAITYPVVHARWGNTHIKHDSGLPT